MITASAVPAAFKVRRTKGFVFFLVKIVGTLICLYVISRSVSWHELVKSLANIRLEWLGFAVLIFWATQIISSLRCAYVARTLGGHLDLATSMRAHFVGLWFNQVLPSSFGGDIMKMSILKRQVGLSIGTRAILIDRFSGLMLLLLVLSVQLPFYSIYFGGDHWLVSIGWTALVAFFAAAAISGVAASINGKYNFPFGVRHAVELVADVWSFRRGRTLWEQFWTSFVVHVNSVLSFVLIGFALDVHISLVAYVLLVPVVFIVALIPVSFAGWGVREAGAILVFSTVGISKESALGMSVSFGMLLLIAGLPGLIAWILRK